MFPASLSLSSSSSLSCSVRSPGSPRAREECIETLLLSAGGTSNPYLRYAFPSSAAPPLRPRGEIRRRWTLKEPFPLLVGAAKTAEEKQMAESKYRCMARMMFRECWSSDCGL